MMQEPENIDIGKSNTRDYVEKGYYSREVYSCVLQAKQIINDNIGMPNPCVIFDIDDTLVSFYDFAKQNDFAWTNDLIEESLSLLNVPIIPEIKSLFDYCVAKNLYVVLLTSRRNAYREKTLALLVNSGYICYDELILRPDEDTGTIQKFKKYQRDILISDKYSIILNIGDQISDLLESPEDEFITKNSIKLPNPLYFISCDI